MARFLNSSLQSLAPYVPGEQPQQGIYIKLNTNENPYPPSPMATKAASEEARRLNLYSDPDCNVFLEPFAEYLNVDRNMVFCGNGSDKVLSIIFQSFCEDGVAFADITYGFYNVYAALYALETEIVPLKEDLTLDPTTYYGLNKTIVIANPNAPTGIAISREDIFGILRHNRNNLVVIDEAYIEFGPQSAIPLLAEFDNLLIVGTFSKSRSLAGARLGYAVSSGTIVEDLNRIKFSINPYNVNRMTLAAAAASIADEEYFNICRQKIIETREFTIGELERLGFSYTNSSANFIFVSHPAVSGQTMYTKLKEKKILVRWFSNQRIKEYVRISIGSIDDMVQLIKAVEEILTEEL